MHLSREKLVSKHAFQNATCAATSRGEGEWGLLPSRGLGLAKDKQHDPRKVFARFVVGRRLYNLNAVDLA